MKITDVKVHIIERENSNVKGSATVTIDEGFAVHDIKIIEGEKGLYIGMPRRFNREGRPVDIAHPINQEVRSMFEREILDAYEKTLNSTETTETAETNTEEE